MDFPNSRVILRRISKVLLGAVGGRMVYFLQSIRVSAKASWAPRAFPDQRPAGSPGTLPAFSFEKGGVVLG
jgi:hypothetical protein